MSTNLEQRSCRRSGASATLSLIAGEFAEAVQLIWAGREGEYLAADEARRHVWHACLAAPATDRNGPHWPETMYHECTSSRARDLLHRAYAFRIPGAVTVFSRLGPQARTSAFYIRLIATLAVGGPAATAVLHGHSLTEDQLDALLALPSSAPKALVTSIAKGSVAADDVAYLTWGLTRLRTVLGDVAYQRVLKSKQPLATLAKEIASAPFPSPPWSGTSLLVPITSRHELLDCAQRFENCIRTQIDERALQVINGSRFFYEWCGTEPVLLEVTRAGTLGWAMSECAGINNRRPSPNTRDAIETVLQTSETMCPSLASARLSWMLAELQ